MIVETWRSSQYDATKIDGRYVRYSGNGWHWIETALIGKWRYDVRKGTLAPSDLPVPIMDQALDLHIAGTWPSYIAWPL